MTLSTIQRQETEAPRTSRLVPKAGGSAATSRSSSARNTALRVLQSDPTRTISIRRKWSTEMTRRFRRLKGYINTTIITNDAFNLSTGSGRRVTGDLLRTMEAAPPGAFNFPLDADKVKGFNRWLRKQIDEGILEVVNRDGATVLTHSGWQGQYVDAAYKRGMRRAEVELKKAGYIKDDPFELAYRSSIQQSLVAPIHIRRLELLYTRAFDELEGITNRMAQKMSRVLADGLAQGQGPRKIARALNHEVGVELTRARTLARTETIRTHHSAMMEMYYQARVEDVFIKVEWMTAGDHRVCPDCAYLDGTIFKLEDAEGLIPLHPNCRCIMIPAKVGEEKRIVTREDKNTSVGDQYLDKKGRFARRGFFEDKTGRKLKGAPKPGRKVKRIEG